MIPSRRAIVTLLLTLLVACEGEPPAPGEDGGPSAMACAADDDCDDGLACNGAERCVSERCEAPAGALCGAGQTCDEATDRCRTDCTVTEDSDGDGHDAVECGGSDCDDADPRRFPGNPEVCDTTDHDEDCDPLTFGVRDQDSDGEPDARCCNVDADDAEICGSDCDDTRGNVYPGQAETCNERDDDCDSAIDEEVLGSFYPDVDGDGFGDSSATATVACEPPAGFADRGGDCDDGAAAANPGAPEICDGIDNDCDAMIDEELLQPLFPDVDRDGAGDGGATATTRCPGEGWVTTSTDCDDTSPSVRPGLSEICDELDNDCDTVVDESTVTVPWYLDSDGDGYGNPRQTAMLSCTPIAGRSQLTECDDTRADVHPGATQLCDRVDNTCSTDDGSGRAPARTSEDADDDGYSAILADCAGGPLPRTDCNDTSAIAYPGAPELCDRVDQNCSSGGGVATDEDFDNDGRAPIGFACSGGTLPRTDCDDRRAATYPGATERCNRIDDDCSSGGGVEPAEDVDSDGYSSPTAMCSGGAFPRTDCDDARMSVNPGALEICNGIDDDCSGGTIDVGCPADVTAGAGSLVRWRARYCDDILLTDTVTCPAGTVATRLETDWVPGSLGSSILASVRLSCSELAIVGAGGAGSPITYTVSVGAPVVAGAQGATVSTYDYSLSCPAGSVITGLRSGSRQIECSPLTVSGSSPGGYGISTGTPTVVGPALAGAVMDCAAGQAIVVSSSARCQTSSGNYELGDWSIGCGALGIDPI